MTSSTSRATDTRKSSHFERGCGCPCSSKSSSPSIHFLSRSNNPIITLHSIPALSIQFNIFAFHPSTHSSIIRFRPAPLNHFDLQPSAPGLKHFNPRGSRQSYQYVRVRARRVAQEKIAIGNNRPCFVTRVEPRRQRNTLRRKVVIS